MKSQNRFTFYSRLTVIIPGLCAALMTAQAASPRLDSADDHLDKASALVKAAGSSGESHTAKTHRERAVRLIEQARQEIARAKSAAGNASEKKPLLNSAPRINY